MNELYFIAGLVVGGALMFFIDAIENYRLHKHNRSKSLQRG